MMRTSRNLIIGLFIAMLITACATTKLTSVWKDPSYQKKPLKIMVIGIAKKPVNKRIFEDEFVRQLQSKGADAIVSYTVMPDAKQEDYGIIGDKMKEYGADAVLITRLVSKKTLKTYVPGSVYYPPTEYHNWRDYYRYGAQAVYVPGYMVEEEYAVVESNLYDAGTDKLIWSASSETEIRGSKQSLIKSYIGVMVDAMAKQNLLR